MVLVSDAFEVPTQCFVVLFGLIISNGIHFYALQHNFVLVNKVLYPFYILLPRLNNLVGIDKFPRKLFITVLVNSNQIGNFSILRMLISYPFRATQQR